MEHFGKQIVILNYLLYLCFSVKVRNMVKKKAKEKIILKEKIEKDHE